MTHRVGPLPIAFAPLFAAAHSVAVEGGGGGDARGVRGLGVGEQGGYSRYCDVGEEGKGRGEQPVQFVFRNFSVLGFVGSKREVFFSSRRETEKLRELSPLGLRLWLPIGAAVSSSIGWEFGRAVKPVCMCDR